MATKKKTTGTKAKRKKASNEREAAVRTLAAASRAWMNTGGLSGDPLATSVTEILLALHAAAKTGDLVALEKKGGPHSWARSYLGGERVVRGRKEEAQAFVSWVKRNLDDLRIDGPQPWRALRKPDLLRNFAEAAGAWLTIRGRRSGLGTDSVSSPDKHVEAAARQLSRAAAREDFDAKAAAVALLRGWGLTPTEARNQLHDAEA